MEPDQSELRRRALNWLSRRDYSEAQLRQRLLRLGGDMATVQQVINWCKDNAYLSEQRFVDMLVRSRANRGYGLNYIIQECKQQHILPQQVHQCVAALNIDWFTRASEVYHKKFQGAPVADYKEKSKRIAYMLRRGFSHEQIQDLVK